MNSLRMLVNVSYPDKKRTRKVNELVGKPYGLFSLTRIKGIGSPRMAISSCSQNIFKLFRVGSGTKHCNIELRPEGIIVWFRNAQETFIWAVPFYQLSVFQNGLEYSIHGGGDFMKLEKAYFKQKITPFMDRLMELKATSISSDGPNP